MKYSVLMTVYMGENPKWFCTSLKSIFTQTARPDEVVVVCDGDLNRALEAVLADYRKKYPHTLRIIRVRDIGVARAAQAGLEACTNEIVARMDSDDIAAKNRCEMQLDVLEKHPEISIVGSYIAEFEGRPDNVVSLRRVPLENAAIAKYCRRRSPFNNQSVMFRKSAVMSVGGYGNAKRCEDYELFAKLIANGCKGMNLPVPLVKYRSGRDNLNRRRNFKNTKSFFKVRWKLYKSGFSSLSDFVVPCTLQLFLFCTPPAVTRLVYKWILR